MAVENVFRSLLNFKYHKLKKVLSNSYYQDLNFVSTLLGTFSYRRMS